MSDRTCQSDSLQIKWQAFYSRTLEILVDPSHKLNYLPPESPLPMYELSVSEVMQSSERHTGVKNDLIDRTVGATRVSTVGY